MKDIIENRFRIAPSTKARLLAKSVKENGLLWTTLIGLYYTASAVAEKSFSLADRIRRKHGLPGMNSPAMNKVIWENWNWTGEGEEWTHSAEWKKSVIEKLLKPNVAEGAVVVELGPGGGRWTGDLQSRAKKLIGIDISEACVRECQKRFAGCGNVEFWVGSGSDLNGVETASIDAVWSFDVFVHINKPEFRAYVDEFARVLKPGGSGVIQHGAFGGATGGWRSDVTKEDVRNFLTSAGLEVADQIQSWRDSGSEFKAGLYGDVVTIFRKPKNLSG
jgi:ubiquinone/menaquinone biosynthesis C-methylase UbiE